MGVGKHDPLRKKLYKKRCLSRPWVRISMEFVSSPTKGHRKVGGVAKLCLAADEEGALWRNGSK